MMSRAEKIERALQFASKYGFIEGDHYKMWVIDQMVRALKGDQYNEWVRLQKEGEEGPDTYEWDEGTPP
jgi:hypothetical protein